MKRVVVRNRVALAVLSAADNKAALMAVVNLWPTREELAQACEILTSLDNRRNSDDQRAYIRAVLPQLQAMLGSAFGTRPSPAD